MFRSTNHFIFVFSLAVSIVGLITMVIVCVSLGYVMDSQPSINQLCEDLRVHKSDLCAADENWFEVIDLAFEPGVTTRQEVNTALNQYLFEVWATESGSISRETYELNRNIFGAIYVNFYYDENGILAEIYYED